eukprot:tig00020537_g10284.t1
MEALPDELVLHVALSLGVKDVLNLSSTCRRFHVLAAASSCDPLWKQLHERDWCTDQLRAASFRESYKALFVQFEGDCQTYRRVLSLWTRLRTWLQLNKASHVLGTLLPPCSPEEVAAMERTAQGRLPRDLKHSLMIVGGQSFTRDGEDSAHDGALAGGYCFLPRPLLQSCYDRLVALNYGCVLPFACPAGAPFDRFPLAVMLESTQQQIESRKPSNPQPVGSVVMPFFREGMLLPLAPSFSAWFDKFLGELEAGRYDVTPSGIDLFRFGSRATTRGVEVVVHTLFVPERSRPGMQYFWAYRIRIANNHPTDRVQLLRRYWQITDTNGEIEEVRGPGVVGETPCLEPRGGRFEYVSACPLRGERGSMRGSYNFINHSVPDEDPERYFDAEIAPFPLAL